MRNSAQIQFKWILKITSETIPDRCCVYWTGTTHKHPETYFKMKIKEAVKRGFNKPYLEFAQDTRVEATIIGKTALQDPNELDAYCRILTDIMNHRDAKIPY